MRWVLTVVVLAVLCTACRGGTSSQSQELVTFSPANGEPSRIVISVRGHPANDVEPNADGSISLAVTPVDKADYSLYVIDSDGHAQGYGHFENYIEPVAVSKSYVVAENRNQLLVYSRASSKRITQRKTLVPLASPYWHTAWIDAGLLITELPGPQRCNSTVTYRTLPDLTRVKTVSLPIYAEILPWDNEYVGLGYRCGSSVGIPVTPVVVVLRRSTLSIVKQVIIRDSAIHDHLSCPFIGSSAPAVAGNLLIFGSDCGGIRVFDLSKMKEIDDLAPFSTATFLQFSVHGDRLLAVGEGFDGDVATEFSLPSLTLLGRQPFPGKQIIVTSGATFEPQGPLSPPYKTSITIYPESAALFPRYPIAESILQGTQKAHGAFISTGDVNQAIALVQASGAIPTPPELRSLPRNVQTAIAWYAGLLVYANPVASDGIALLRALHADLPHNSAIGVLLSAAEAGSSAQDGVKILGATESGLFVGTPPTVPVASSAKYLVIAPVCIGPQPSAASMLTITIIDVARRALSECYAGVAGLEVVNPADLTMQAYVPVMTRDSVDQQYLASIAILGHIAYATIISRFPNNSDVNLVAVDLEKDRVVAKSHGPIYATLRAISGVLVGCTGDDYQYLYAADTCYKINPSSLAQEGAFPGLRMPNQSMPDSTLAQLVQRKLGRFAHEARAMTADGLLVELPTMHLALIHGATNEPSPLAGKFAVLSFGVSADESQYAYIIGIPVGVEGGFESARTHLIRVDMNTGATLNVDEGAIQPLNLIRVGPLVAYLAGSTIRVRDAHAGRFLCAWSFRSSQPAQITWIYNDAPAKALLLIRTPEISANGLVSQSLVINDSKFVSESLECAHHLQSSGKPFRKALAQLSP